MNIYIYIYIYIHTFSSGLWPRACYIFGNYQVPPIIFTYIYIYISGCPNAGQPLPTQRNPARWPGLR